MQNNYKYQRTVPEDISQNFTISPDDPKVPTTPERNSPYYNGVDYEAEISSILQTPPSSQEPTHHHTIRRTPGAEIAGNVNTRLEEFDSPFQILQALQNLKLSTEPGSYESAESSYPYSTSSREPTASPFTDQYSLWGPQPTQNRRFESNTSIMGSSNSSNLSHFNQTAEYNAFDNPFNSRMMNQSAQQYPHFMHGPASGNAQPFWFTGGSSGGGGFNMPPHHPTTNPNSSMNSGFSTPPIPESSHHSRNSDSQGAGYSMQQARNHAPVVHRRQASTSESSRPIVPSSSHKRSASTSNEEVVKSSTPIQIKSNANAGKEKESNSNSLADSPTSNMKFKQFYREFKQKEKETYIEATSFAMENLKMLPEKVHWRVFLELADLAKRENRIDEARGYYEQVNRLEPTAAQGWLEYAKMEEECGNLNACKRILSSGLSNCTVNESLMVKCLKHYERMENLEEARQLLGALKDIPIERTWRTIMEGGLLEARQGNILVARQVFHYLIRSVPWYGPIYQEACRFEEKCEEPENAIQFVESGLRENPRYGPLWFSALRLNEKLSENGDVSSVHETIERAVKSISKELIWKLYFEAAQIEERAGNIDVSREFYVKSVSYCPENLLWKVWMGGARTELNYDNIEIARKLLKRALKEVPPKMKAMVLLECSRLEEYANNLDKAREILAKAKKYTKHEWKVFLESVLLEMRANNLERAIDEAQRALEIHTGTGRLWAVMIQLKQSFGIESQMNVFRTALSEVPKSGEVWCEGARIALQQKNFEAARKYINFAIQFTPQYGDSFIEYLRLEILEKDSNANLRAVEQACVNADPNYGALWLHCKRNPLDSTRNVIREAIRLLTTPQSASDEVPAETALMVNDIYQNVHQRSKEERRKAIFL